MSGKPVPIENRFWSKVDRRGPDECWLWLAGKSKAGYGMISSNRCLSYAHRKAYELVIGMIPPRMHVLHKCDVRGCVNPAHLFLGTHADNMADMIAKGRARKAKGAAAAGAKLTAEQVQSIRAATETQKRIAAQFGVSEHQIWCIRKGMYWQ